MKTVCVHHKIDLDGWMSAAIVKHWFFSNRELDKIKTIEENDNYLLTFIGYNYGDPLPDLSGYDRVIMVDCSFPKENMLFLANKFGVNFIWIDHHQRTINEVNKCLIDFSKEEIEGLVTEEGELKAACELAWQYFFSNENMPEIVRLLGMYDSFRHKNTSEEQKVLVFQYGARSVMFDVDSCYKWLLDTIDNPYNIEDVLLKGEGVYSFLCTEAKQAYKNGFSIELIEKPIITHYDTEKGGNVIDEYPVVRKFICINKERFNPINFGIDYHSEGYDGAACFHYADGMWKFSLYNDNGLVDCSAIAKQYSGGGHKGASGFVVKDINQIINQ